MEFKTKNIWDDNWETIKSLDPSGQGKTVIVRNRNSKKEAIIKILKNQKSKQARRRMFIEVSNLKVLKGAGCKVPKVIKNNVDQFEDIKIPLYFIMEKIKGKTLLETVRENNGLSINNAIDLTLDLADSFKIALNEEVLHRDIKPENIIVRSIKKRDAVIVDYGLSFNTDIDSDLTQTDETLDNTFLSLPERRVRGGSRRDVRSDLTGICGIFFYCLTNELPIDLRDEKERAPNRRVEEKLKEVGDSEITYALLEAFFDQGFSLMIESRFQTIEDLISRLNEIKNPGIKSSSESLLEFAKKTKELMIKYDRKTKLELIRENVNALGNIFPNVINDYNKRIQPFALSTTGIDHVMSQNLSGEETGVSGTFIVRETHYEYQYCISYQIRIDDQQCTLYRAISRNTSSKPREFRILENWQSIYHFDGLSKLDDNLFKKDIEANILEGMKILQREILEENE